MKQITAEEVEKRLRAWADVTMPSPELKHAAPKKKYPALDDQAITTLMRERHAACIMKILLNRCMYGKLLSSTRAGKQAKE